MVCWGFIKISLHVIPMVIDTARINQNGVGVKQLFGNVNLILQLVHGKNNVLKNLFGKSHRSDSRGCGEFQERRFWW